MVVDGVGEQCRWAVVVGSAGGRWCGAGGWW